MNNSGTAVSSSQVPTESQSDEQVFLVNEFSVETTQAPSAATTANTAGGGVQTEQGATASSVSTSSNETVRTTQPTTDGSSTSASLMAVASSGTSAAANQEAPISEAVSTAIVKQLEEQPTVAVTTVRIQLDRADLGSISLFLSINNNRVSVRIVAEDELARQIIDSQMDELRQALDESGVECSEFQVVCDATHDHSSPRKRSPQRLIALGFASSTVNSEPKAVMTEPSSPLDRFNFVA
jgi:flagellar hook-length control protein FliK